MRDNEVFAYFSISDFDCEPDEITRKVQVLPTKFWSKGEANENLRERKFSRWSLFSRLSKTKDLEKPIEDVLLQLDKNPQEFRLLSEKFGGQIQLVGYFYQYYPGFSLESRIIEKIAYYKLSLDCDFYYLYSKEREDTY